MKLTFEEDDIKKLLLDKAQSMGVPADTVVFHASYGRFDRADVFQKTVGEAVKPD